MWHCLDIHNFSHEHFGMCKLLSQDSKDSKLLVQLKLAYLKLQRKGVKPVGALMSVRLRNQTLI